MNLLKFITPTNISGEKIKFFSDDNYDPQFRYAWEDRKIELDKNNGKYELISSILAQDHSAIALNALKYFEVNLEEYTNLARDKTTIKPEEFIHIVEESTQEFEKAFNLFALDYKVEILDHHGFNFRPSPSNKKIYISKHANLQFFDIEGEVKHEMVHIIRSENSKFNKIKSRGNYLPTEEGLATFVQDSAKGGASSLFQHAAEYIASSIGSQGSLRDIFNFLTNIGFNSELAWQRSIRHKFGYKDTSKPGDIIKPAMYFYHSQKITALSLEDMLKLFVGKIPLSDLNDYSEYKGKFDKKLIKDFFDL